jgi:hypothetical protein
MLEGNLLRWIPACAGMSGVRVVEAPPHPQLWSMSKPYPTSVTVSRIIFLSFALIHRARTVILQSMTL